MPSRALEGDLLFCSLIRLWTHMYKVNYMCSSYRNRQRLKKNKRRRNISENDGYTRTNILSNSSQLNHSHNKRKQEKYIIKQFAPQYLHKEKKKKRKHDQHHLTSQPNKNKEKKKEKTRKLTALALQHQLTPFRKELDHNLTRSAYKGWDGGVWASKCMKNTRNSPKMTQFRIYGG